MKLVELLADKLESWPIGVIAYAQDASGDIYGYSDEPRYSAASWVGGAAPGQTLGCYATCDDQSTAFVVRGDWQFLTELAHAEFIPEPAFDAVAASIRIRQLVDGLEELREERDRLCAELAEHGLAVPGVEYKRPLKALSDAYPGLLVQWIDDVELFSVVDRVDGDSIHVIHSDGGTDWCAPNQLIACPR